MPLALVPILTAARWPIPSSILIEHANLLLLGKNIRKVETAMLDGALARPSRNKVMIVDDDDDDLYLMKKAIALLSKRRELDIDFKYCTSGFAAVSEIDHGRGAGDLPQTILLDLNMPGVTGLDVLRHCRSHEIDKQVDIVVVTTGSDTEVHDSAIQSGAKSVYVKPNSIHEMVDLLSHLLLPEQSV